MSEHKWIKSQLGHGETMCTICFATNREAAALGLTSCPGPAENDAADEPDEPGEDCGRWCNGKLDRYCAKAGTEECDFECPYRDSECVKY